LSDVEKARQRGFVADVTETIGSHNESAPVKLETKPMITVPGDEHVIVIVPVLTWRLNFEPGPAQTTAVTLIIPDGQAVNLWTCLLRRLTI
jgi:hypothetical protein